MGVPLISTVQATPGSGSEPRIVSDADHFLGTDRFLIQRRLGAGAFGVVYEAYDRRENALVALKVLRLAEADALYRFKKDFRSLADIRHPNLVAFYELMNHDDLWFFSMELIPGVPFDEALRAGLKPGEQPDFERVRSVTAQLAKGLQTVHDHGKVHRDIKPPNVLVTPEDRVKLLDFGLVAELTQGHSAEVEHQMVGTPAYMSPEQANGHVGNPSSDWYSVGVMLYQALLGQLPFEGSLMKILTAKQDGVAPDAIRSRLPEVPEDLEQVCLGFLETDPVERLTGPSALSILGGRLTATSSFKAVEIDIPFVGRERPLAELDDALEASRDKAVVVTVRGPSGMGKSALVARFTDRVLERDPQAVVLSGRCYVQESVPYKAIDNLIDALSRFLMSLPAQEAEVLLPAHIAALARLFPVLARVPSVARAPTTRENHLVEPQILRRRAFAALRELLSRLAVRRTLVLVIDDLQWGDLDSAMLLDELLKAADTLPLLLIGCYRSENEHNSSFLRALSEQRRAFAWRGVDMREIQLGELSNHEARELVQRLGGIADAQADELLSDAEGSPLFLSELARVAGRQASAGFEQSGDSASKVNDLIRLRVGRVSPEAKALLEVVAIAGQPLALEIARQAAGLESGGISAVSELRQERLVRLLDSSEQEVETYHDRIREALTELMSEDQLRALHGRLAEALESSGRADPETLAMHFQATEEVQRASRYAVSAAERAEEALAFDRAARLYELALELGPLDPQRRSDLQVRLGEALGNAGRSRDAAETLLAAVGSGIVDPLEAQRSAAEKLLISGHIDRGLAVLRHVLRTVDLELEPRPWKSLLSLWWWRLRLRLRGFDFKEKAEQKVDTEALRRIDVCWSVVIGLCLVDVLRASEFHVRHLWLALEEGEPQRVARGLAMEVFFGSMEGSGGLAALDRARELAGKVEGRYAASLTEMAAGMLACSKGEWRDAQRRLSRAEMHLRENRRGVTWELDTVRQFRAVALLNLGRWSELFLELPTLLEQAKEQEDLYLETHLHHWVESIKDLVEDRPAEAAEAAESGSENWSQQGFHYQHFGHLSAQTQVSLYRGKGIEAWQRIDARWVELTASMIQRIEMVWVQSHDLRGRSALAAAAELQAGGRLAEMRPLLKQASADARRLDRMGTAWPLALASALRAGVASLRGEPNAALEALAVAEAAFESADMAIHAAAVQRHRALVEGDAREIEAADQVMVGAGIARPDRFAFMLSPGHWAR